MTPQIDCLGKMSPVLRSFNTHLCSFQGDRWKNVHFSSKPRHRDPSNRSSWRNEPCAESFNSTFMDSKEIDGKMFIFRVNLGMWPLKSIILVEMSPVLRVPTAIYTDSKQIDRKMFIFQLNLGMWPLKLIVSEKWALFWGFQHTFMGFLRR